MCFKKESVLATPFSTTVDIVGTAAILNVHSHIQVAAPTNVQLTMWGPKLEQSNLQLNFTNEDWNAFHRRWEIFWIGSGRQDATSSLQFLECISEQLRNIVFHADPAFTSEPMADAMKTLASVAVVPVARTERFAMRQNPDEPFYAFSGHVVFHSFIY